MKHLVIIGARGFGREVFDFVHWQRGYQNGEYDVKGFLDDQADALADFPPGAYAPILGPVETYEPASDDIFICALGDPHWRKAYAEKILDKGGKFVSLVSDGACVSPSARIGVGVIVAGWTSISSDADVGDFVVVHPFCDIGHDVRIGDYCTIESYTFMGGYSKIGDGTTMHVRSSVLPHMELGKDCVVATGAAVMRDFPDGVHLMGNPARRFEF